MLDTGTKTRIDSARDILVGKVPDPKSQVEQITIALIYKFMDDMDHQSEELGGKASFFTGDFKKYRWAQLLDKRYSGHERLLLYAEGIEKMNQNKNIPQLFRDIFKGVFLPYRDPETLNLFLKEIAGFSYDHSEQLGDAYEYLLSVLGTQGNAGQFRTPRHIIDFIVAVVDPKKQETVLDPACGTAGFLISAYKHILKQNKNLTPDERARLMTDFRGYDIAPDMVRLSRVNMYLHGFPNPVIHEYDTLTSEERWDERCDVIMANPPFMTPKGGIRPHNHFSIKAKRSEVLFVDYIAEHLNPGGRAGVIVPEGIIFQSQNAYRDVRRVLVKDYLWAVVSLPAGVFNPYSGVKTSILFIDRNLAKRMDEVLFVKIENDGFDLGAQRRPVDGSQLTEVLRILNDHKEARKAKDAEMVTVSRKRLLESPDINLSGDRFRVVAARPNGKWPVAKLGPYTSLVSSGVTPLGGKDNYRPNGVLFIRSQNVLKGHCDFSDAAFISKELHEDMNRTHVYENDVLLNITGASIGRCAVYKEQRLANVNQHVCIIRPDQESLNSDFLCAVINAGSFQDTIMRIQSGASRQALNFQQIRNFDIPLPPLREQERIAAELEGYRKVIEGARQILITYKPSIQINPKWPIRELRELITEKPKNGYSGKPVDYPTPVKVLSLSATTSGRLDLSQFKYLDEEIDPRSSVRCRKGDILLQRGNTAELVGTAALFDSDYNGYVYPDLMIRVRADETVILGEYLVIALQSPDSRTFIKNHASGSAGSMPKINQSIVESIPIPLPPLDVQRRIVAELGAERKLVEANRELIARMEAKIKAKLAEVWGETKD